MGESCGETDCCQEDRRARCSHEQMRPRPAPPADRTCKQWLGAHGRLLCPKAKHCLDQVAAGGKGEEAHDSREIRVDEDFVVSKVAQNVSDLLAEIADVLRDCPNGGSRPDQSEYPARKQAALQMPRQAQGTAQLRRCPGWTRLVREQAASKIPSRDEHERDRDHYE